MRKATLLLVMCAIVAVAIVAPMAQGTGGANPVATLEKKVKALQARVGALESQAATTNSDVAGAKTDLAAVQANVATLQSGASTLQSGVAALQSSVGTLTTSVGCVRYKVMPIARYQGYVYSNDGGKTLGLTTALDATDAGQTPSAYAALVNPSCVSSTAAIHLSSQTQRIPESLHSR